MIDFRAVSWRAPYIAVVAVLLLLVGCANAPVQEMSDARQAIHAAEEAGAAAVVPETLQDAKRLLTSAERKLQREAYGAARADAREARRLATEALRAARSRED